MRRAGFWGLAACIAIGAVLRLVWLDEMEYKGDQIYIWNSCQSAFAGAALPALGMPSGAQLLNPGMSLWWHIGFCELFSVRTPLELAYFSPVLGVIALLLLWWFAARVVPDEERPPWLWAVALASVSTLAISLERIIWSQTILPCFSVLFLWSWWRRDRVSGAFFWGLIGAMLGQIHMSGFFLAAAFALGEAWSRKRPVRWSAWAAGTALGAITLLPWLAYLGSELAHPHRGPGALKRLGEIAKGAFWIYSLTEPWGLEFGYRLGFRSWLEFLTYPLVSGHATYLIGLCHVLLVCAGLRVYGRAVRERPKLRELLERFRSGAMSETNRAILMALLGMGILLTLTGQRLHRHYLIVTFPLTSVLFCQLALRLRAAGRALLAGMCGLQIAVSIGFLYFVHVRGGAPAEEYGTPYRLQQAASTSAASRP
jgi:hypothetical protein